MTDKIYLHGICANERGVYDSFQTIRTLNRILRSRYLLSLRLQRQFVSYGFNGLDYISLCDYEKRNEAYQYDDFYNSYHAYIRPSLSFAFPKSELKVVEPIILEEKCISTKKGYKKMSDLGNSKYERYSDYADEVQVKGRIPISKSCGITFPTHSLAGKYSSLEQDIDRILYEIETINELIDYYKFNLEIFDIDTFERLDSASSIRNVLKFKSNN